MLNSLFKFKPRDVPINVALRNTAAFIVPLGVGVAAGQPGIGLGISVGALNTMFSDQPGPYRLRMRRMLFAAAAAALSAFVGFTLGGHDVLIALVALLWGFAGGLLVALGPDASRIGLTSMILVVVTAAEPLSPGAALGPSLLIFAGGVLLMLFAIAAWPLHRYRPERLALSQLCRQLAGSMRSVDATHAPPVTQAVTNVESVLHGSYRAHGPGMEALRVLAEQIERIRLELVALAGMEERPLAGEAGKTLPRLREYAARVLDSVGDALAASESPLTASAALEGFDAALAVLDKPGRDDDLALTLARAHAHALGGQLRAMARNADFVGSRGELRLAAEEQRLPRDLQPRDALATLRANLRLSSIACRHAIRCGVCLALAMIGSRLASVEHGYWIPMTVAIVLKPDFAGTFSFGLLRVIGTLLGLALVSLLLHVAFGGEWSRIILLGLLCFGFREVTTMQYGFGVMFLTGMIVVLLSFEGIAPGEAMTARAISTTAGSVIALLAYLAWPTWEVGRVRGALADLIDAYRRYFMAVLGDDHRVRADVRSASRSARTNAQASLDRLHGEPRPDAGLVTLADGLFANANRFIRIAMTLEAIRQTNGATPIRDQVKRFATEVDRTLTDIAACLRDSTALSTQNSLREEQRKLVVSLQNEPTDGANRIPAAAWIDASDRLTNTVNTLAHLLRRQATQT